MLMRVAADADRNRHASEKKEDSEGFRCREGSHLLLTNGGVGHDDHDVGVGGEDVNEGGKVGVPHFHALERRRQLAVTTT